MLVELFLAICMVESSNNPLAIGDNGCSVGIVQIQKVVVDDVNRFAKTNYTYEDRKCPQKSKEMFMLYVLHWGDYYTDKTGRELTHRVVCDIWNGGATAPIRKQYNDELRKNLDHYFNKVIKEL